MKKCFFALLLALAMLALTCGGALAFDIMDPPQPGAAEGWYPVTGDVWMGGRILSDISYVFDDQGRVVSSTEVMHSQDQPQIDGTATTTLYEYDDQGRLSLTAQPDGNHEMRYEYNEDGSHYLYYTWHNESGAYATIRTYDPCADWYWYGKWQFSYDDQGNTARRWNDSGEDWVYANQYDSQGRLARVDMVSQKDGVQEYQTFTYPEEGGCVWYWGSRTGGEEFTYNAQGRLVKYNNTYADFAYTYEYDGYGNNTRIYHNDDVQYNFTYAQLPADNNPFADVASGDYFYEPVMWAVESNPQITNGTDATHFSPADTCTRGQIVTFLWRAKGCPEPGSSVNPFVDVKASDYYYKAVLWAVEQGVTSGMDATHFGPAGNCTRAQAVTFLWRAEGKPAVGGANPFSDVKSGDYYYDAVLWAVQKDITKGTDASHFSPGNACTRAQIVTFLWRDLAFSYEITIQ